MSGDWKSFDVDISSTNWVDVFGVRPCTVRALDLADDMMTMLATVSMTICCVYIFIYLSICVYHSSMIINISFYFFYVVVRV